MEALGMFVDQVYEAPMLVWTMSVIMSLIAGYVLSNFLDCTMIYSVFATLVFFVGMLVTQTVFLDFGIFFMSNREANIVASSGAAVSLVMLGFVAATRAWYAVSETMTPRPGAQD